MLWICQYCMYLVLAHVIYSFHSALSQSLDQIQIWMIYMQCIWKWRCCKLNSNIGGSCYSKLFISSLKWWIVRWCLQSLKGVPSLVPCHFVRIWGFTWLYFFLFTFFLFALDFLLIFFFFPLKKIVCSIFVIFLTVSQIPWLLWFW